MTHPSFGPAEVRRWMDVFSFDSEYLGNVLLIRGELVPARLPDMPDDARQSSVINGETLGPAPTQEVGNTGPVRQAAASDFGIWPTSGYVYQDGRMLVGKYFGLMNRRWFRFDDIQTVALERIVLHRRSAELYG